MPLKDIKESNPIEVAEFAVAKGIDKEPAFAWWIPYTIRKRKNIISAVCTRLKLKTHKFGIEIPRSVEQNAMVIHFGEMRLKRKWQM